MWTLLACERRLNTTFTYVCKFTPYSKILTGVNFVHVNGALVKLNFENNLVILGSIVCGDIWCV